MQGWKEKTCEEQDNFSFGQRFRSEPIPPQVVHIVFTSSLNTKRQGFALERDSCASHQGCVPRGKETQVYVADETYGLFQVVSLLALCVRNRTSLYSSICLFS